MPEIQIDDFSAGWCPSDDAHGGRKNALLRMTGVTLDENGALVLANGTKKGSVVYPSNAHTLFSKYVCDSLKHYLALADGSVYRDSTAIVAAAAGSLTRAAFGVYGDFVLIFSGDSRIKDGCDGISNIAGVGEPTEEVLVNSLISTSFSGSGVIGTVGGNFLHNFNGFGAGFTVVSATEYSVAILNLSGDYYLSYDVNAGTSDWPKDLSGSETDVFSFNITCNRLTSVQLINIAFLLDYDVSSTAAPAAATVNSNNYYTANWTQQDILASAVGNTATLSITRAEFIKAGGSASGWEAIVGFSSGITVPLSVTDAVAYFSDFKFSGSDALNGTYEYVQVNVIKSNNYFAFSPIGPVASAVNIVNGTFEIIPQDPTLIDSQVTEVWIYRRGGDLPVFYRVGVVLYDELGPFYDILSDDDILALGITIVNTLSISADDLDVDIIEVVGPVNGRMLYFSISELFFSEINAPENYNPAITMEIAGDEAEKFLFARKVAENIVVVGTTRDNYILTGTFQTFPDGSIDVQFRALGVDKPAICRDAVVYKGGLIYFAAGGWVLMSVNGEYGYITAPNTDVLYDGKTRYEYGGVPTASIFSTIRYPLVVSKEKVYCVVPYITNYLLPSSEASWTGRRLEIYDFIKKYWYPIEYAPDLVSVSDDGAVFGFFNGTKRLDQLNYPFSKLLNKT